MNKILLSLMAILILGCGKETYPLLLKVDQLRATKQSSLENFIDIHQHFALLKELLETQIPKKVKIPKDTNCSEFTLNSSELKVLSMQCENGFFDVCPRAINNYSEMAKDFINRCEELRKD
ncbi:MAG: hypothetical protein COW01_03480 [Bdellovibrionales bacterium CG12_big_fil_rev_8_21_14_0_65_38_15]|nr:MAG: hypothetical protein COW79_02040 [Bdellovibrionales bacterium CG22_combo_CG10-13_8_21_14_all_38_13]PIQ56906.1 MAG: hypothetical protein COW01_03480 [Bdellovibrionales bacterium CG12_big_fil_rev_8_21_14_0_65_38_15]PIR30071.1 MAG: hypothetical protein COV38_07200 [Bdellovibrionales bacterium CG11_big_fil_rev_8_21_14_0_20_38_13]